MTKATTTTTKFEAEVEEKIEKRSGCVIPKAGSMTQDFTLDPTGLEWEGTTIKSVTIATDQVVMRSFGEERLVISEEAINLSHFESHGVSLLKGHNSNDREYGWVKNPRVVEGKLIADIEFDAEYDESMEIFRSIVNDKKPKCVSIGYLSDLYETERMGASMAESRTVTKWTLFDLSMVGYGEDEGAGFYRNASATEALKQEKIEEKDKLNETRETIGQDLNSLTDNPMPEDTKETKKINEAEVAAAAAKSERASIAAVMALCDQHNVAPDTKNAYIRNGTPLESVKDEILKGISERGATAPKVMFADNLDKSPEKKYKEGKYSLSMRSAMAAAAARFANNPLKGEAGLAYEISQDVAKNNIQSQNADTGVQFPFDALQTRAFQATSGGLGATGQVGAGTGQALISTVVQDDRLKMYLFENTVTGKLVTDIVVNQTNNPAIPVITEVGEAQFPGEGNVATPQSIKSKNIPVIAKPIICGYPVTNLAQAQIPSMNSRIERILMKQLNRAVDRTTLVGGGSGEAVGICATAGINTAKAGAVGDATRNMDMDEINELIGDIQEENITGDLDIVAPPKLLRYWRGLRNDNGTKRWEVNTFNPNQGPSPLYLYEARVNMSTNLKAPGDNALDRRFLIGDFSDNVTQVFFGNSFSLTVGLNADDLMRDQLTFKMAVYYDVVVGRPEAFRAFSAIRPGAGD